MARYTIDTDNTVISNRTGETTAERLSFFLLHIVSYIVSMYAAYIAYIQFIMLKMHTVHFSLCQLISPLYSIVIIVVL